MIIVQEKDFNSHDLIKSLIKKNKNIGAICSFTGLVREKNNSKKLISMTLDNCTGMAEKMLDKIEESAYKRWSLIDTLIIHRYGILKPGDQIVLVATLSRHREESINSCHFLIDWLKTKGPFWKYEKTESGGNWVEAKESDDKASENWNK